MSRFKDNYEALDEKKWLEIKNTLANSSEEELENNSAAADELDRLKLVVTTLADSLQTVQPFVELINPDIQNHVKSFDNHLRNFQSASGQQKLNHLGSLNNTATGILERVWPFLSKSDAVQAAGRAFDRYKDRIEVAEANIKSLRLEADAAIAAIRKTSSDLTAYREELLDGNEETASIKDQISDKIGKIDEMLSTTEQFYQRLTQGDAGSLSIMKQISDAQRTATETSSEIDNKLRDTEQKLKELDEIYLNVAGASDPGEDHQKGLKGQLEDRQDQLNKMVGDFGKKFEVLVEQVEGLLPGATSAGLAYAYKDLRTTAETRAARYSYSFFVLVGLLTLAAAATITQSVSILTLSWQAVPVSSVSDYFTQLLFKLPIVAPILWAALAVSKRRSEMHRLAEEYAHKEALAKSYEGFKKQIIELNKEDSELLAELLAAMLKAVSLNAATTLDGRHGERMPIQEFAEEAKRLIASQVSPT